MFSLTGERPVEVDERHPSSFLLPLDSWVLILFGPELAGEHGVYSGRRRRRAEAPQQGLQICLFIQPASLNVRLHRHCEETWVHAGHGASNLSTCCKQAQGSAQLCRFNGLIQNSHVLPLRHFMLRGPTCVLVNLHFGLIAGHCHRAALWTCKGEKIIHESNDS